MKAFLIAASCAISAAIAGPVQHVMSPDWASQVAVAPLAHVPASIDLSLDKRFLGFVAEAVVTVLTTKVSSLDVPDIRRQLQVPVLGTVDLVLSQTRVSCTVVNSTTTAQARFEAMPDGRLGFHASGLNITINAKWKWTAGFLQSSGTMKAILSDTTVSAYLMFRDGAMLAPFEAADAAGNNFHLQVTDPQVKFGKVDLTISDSLLTWLYRWIQDTFLKDLRDTVSNVIKFEFLNTLPNSVNRYVRNMPTYRRLWRNVFINFPIHQYPRTNGTGLVFNIGFEGRVGAWDGRLEKCPYTRDPVAHLGPIASPRMVNVVIDEPVFNCMVWALHKERFFEYTFVINLVDDASSAANMRRSLAAAAVDVKQQERLQLAKGTNGTAPRVELGLSLPPTAVPRLSLLQTGQIGMTLPQIYAKVLVYLNGTEVAGAANPPFSLTIGLNTSFTFEPRLVDYTRPTPDMLQWHLKHSNIDTTIVEGESLVNGADATTALPAATVNAIVEWVGGMPLHMAADCLELVSQQAFTTGQGVARGLQPVPVVLPFPLDSIMIDELELQIVRGAWTLQADLSIKQ